MSFLHPSFIYVMIPILFVVFYFLFTQAKEHYSMFDESVLKRLSFEGGGLGRRTRNVLFFLASVFMVFALAQPVFKDGEIKVEAKSADILIGIDISDSMKAEDAYPNRLELAKSKAIELIKAAPHNRIGVLAFAKHDYIVSPLSFDHASVAFLLSKVETGSITEKGTRLDSMIHSAVQMLEHSKEKNLLLFSDGGDEENFDGEIALAKEKGLRIFVLSVGTKEGSPVRSSEGGFVKQHGNILISKLNPELKNLATGTGGVYIESVLGESDINAMIKEIEEMSKKSTLKEEIIPQYTQLFYYPLGLALFLLLLAFSSLPRRANVVLLLSLLFVHYEDVRADLLDFQKLQGAQEAYSKEEYKKSAAVYESFADQSPEAEYNYANSLYKDKAYENALEAYAKVKTDDPAFKAQTLHNSGNTHVQLKQYEEALKAYEASLDLKEDLQTRENYEAVKKFLEEQKKEQQQDDKKDQNKQNNEKNESKEKQESNKDKPTEDQKSKESNSDTKDKQEQEKQKSDQQQDKEDQQEKQTPEKSQEKDEEEKNKDELNKQEQEEKAASDHSKQDKEEKQKSEAKKEPENLPVQMKQMSDLEAKKWLKAVQQSQKGHLYKMAEAKHEEDENEKPW